MYSDALLVCVKWHVNSPPLSLIDTNGDGSGLSNGWVFGGCWSFLPVFLCLLLVTVVALWFIVEDRCSASRHMSGEGHPWSRVRWICALKRTPFHQAYCVVVVVNHVL